MFVAILLAALAVTAPWTAFAAECHGSPNPNAQPNLNPIYTDAPVFVNSVPNAALYTVGGGNDTISVVHLWGTPYEMGFAHGTLMKKPMLQFLDRAWAYLEAEAESALNGSGTKLKPWVVDLLAEGGLSGALQFTVDATRPWTGAYFDEELSGMAAATGYDLGRLRHIHMIGEATRGSCSMFGAWGNATRSSGGGLLQLRALDWDMDGPFRDFPQLTVYHPAPATGQGHPFVNIGWTGFIGSVTGFSSAQVAISEIGVSYPDATFGPETRFGVPFTYLLRDILQFDGDLGAAESHITSARRTCNLIFGVGDGKGALFRGVQYAADHARFFTDTDMEPTAPWHPRMDSVVYYGMDWLCPGYTTVLAAQLTALHGALTPEATIRNVTAIVQTGDLHIAVYDLANMVLHTANARRTTASGPDNAYDRPFVRVDMAALFAVQPPAV